MALQVSSRGRIKGSHNLGPLQVRAARVRAPRVRAPRVRAYSSGRLCNYIRALKCEFKSELVGVQVSDLHGVQ